MRKKSIVLAALVLLISVVVAAALTHHQDNSRTGPNISSGSKAPVLKVTTASGKSAATTPAPTKIAALDSQAKTADQVAIAKTLDDGCVQGATQAGRADATTLVAVGIDQFFTSQQYVLSGNFARANTGCADKDNITANSSDGGSASILQAGSDRSWTVLYSGQMYPECSLVDGKGMPSTITMCNDNGKTRSPS